MGSCSSKNAASVRAIDFVLGMYPQTLGFLELSAHSHKLAEMFAECDKNGSQNLSINEFLTFCKVARTRASVRLFSIFDSDGSGSLDFREIMVTVWHLCTLEHRGLEALVFDLYDDNQDGTLSVADMTRLMEDCYGHDSLEDNPNIARVLKSIAKAGSMDRDAFLKFCSSSPQTMKQVIDLQKGVRDHVLGAHVWKKLTKKRLQRTDAAFRPENWAQLMERVIVLDITARHRAGEISAADAPPKKLTSGPSGEGEGDSDGEGGGAAVTSKGMKEGKGKKGKKRKGALPTNTRMQHKDGDAAEGAKGLTIEMSGEQAAGVGGGGGEGAAPPAKTGGYKTKDRKAERAAKLRERDANKRNALGNTGKPGVYED